MYNGTHFVLVNWLNVFLEERERACGLYKAVQRVQIRNLVCQRKLNRVTFLPCDKEELSLEKVCSRQNEFHRIDSIRQLSPRKIDERDLKFFGHV